MVAKPVGIRTVLSNIPFYTGHDGGDPRRYFNLGRFTMGNSDGFQMSHGLEYGNQLLYPMPPVWEILAYDIKDGASCLFQELVDVPDLSLKQPWDRTMLPITQFAQADVADGGGEATLWSYSVPTGRRLWISSARVNMSRYGASTVASLCTCWIATSVGYLALATMHGRNIGDRQGDFLNGGPMILTAGQTVAASRYTNSGNGSVNYQANLQGFLFDA